MFTVISPGPRSLFQDRGRQGYEHLGVPTAGAADRHAHDLANALVGNDPSAATIEVALGGLVLTSTMDATVAFTGADADIWLNETRLPHSHSIFVPRGATIRIGTFRSSVYGYLSVAGGFAPDEVLGSRSTCTLSGLGPAPLQTGQDIPLGFSEGHVTRATRERVSSWDGTCRFVPGPHTSLFTDEALASFQETEWSVSEDVSRVGIRLNGTPLPTSVANLGSLGMLAGAIQVPPSGLPVVLGPDHGATGGYPVIGCVVPSDLSLLLQSRPGTEVSFAPVAVSSAEADWGTLTSSAQQFLALDLLSA